MSYDLVFNSLSKKLIRELIYKDDDGAVVEVGFGEKPIEQSLPKKLGMPLSIWN